MNDCITTTKQSTTKPCAYFLGYTVHDVQKGPITYGGWLYGGDLNLSTNQPKQ